MKINKVILLISILNVLNAINILLSFNYLDILTEGTFLFIISCLLIMIVIFYLISNFLLITGSRDLILIWFNLVLSFVQIIHINIFGVILDFSYGFVLMPWLSLSPEILFDIRLTLCEIFTQFQYRTADTNFFLGVNLFQLVVFFTFKRFKNFLPKQN